ncbi:hypothetical protein VHEMI02712 [[Torrubiella] hemipterigena]|uniref:Uncharacterized protein n=1 Tax=[Torrubiella] hemipterigena TaxID=1531966 RepID=A0A0A1SQJ3_9HYPO|nr:hypothetical protein VHEMI02712 [[Torrubiella] hemipterigena]
MHQVSLPLTPALVSGYSSLTPERPQNIYSLTSSSSRLILLLHHSNSLLLLFSSTTLFQYLHFSHTPPTTTMCDYTQNYYIYMSCIDPGMHFCSTSTDGSRHQSCQRGPHERYIVIPESCPLCSG